jgi:hypothetical protein
MSIDPVGMLYIVGHDLQGSSAYDYKHVHARKPKDTSNNVHWLKGTYRGELYVVVNMAL